MALIETTFKVETKTETLGKKTVLVDGVPTKVESIQVSFRLSPVVGEVNGKNTEVWDNNPLGSFDLIAVNPEVAGKLFVGDTVTLTIN